MASARLPGNCTWATTLRAALPKPKPPNNCRPDAELQNLGYRGGYQTISDYLRPRLRKRIRVVAPAPPSVRQATGWMMRHPEHLGDQERQQLDDILAQCPDLTALHERVRAFAEILTTRSGQHLKDWVTATRAEDLPRLHTFVAGLEKDWDAVVQGLTTRWNSGPVEGRFNHIKMIKRQMFGRAKLPLPRKRVLLTAAQGSHCQQARPPLDKTAS
ncbi:transposase [Streptomyces niveus]|uniref:transposase n=1 Tax=Streptomyces niveus TaxID=193462 RepID=UPI00364C8BC4